MSINLKCAACGHKVPFEDGEMNTEAICPGCEVLLRRRSGEDQVAIPVSMELPETFEPADLTSVRKPMGLLFNRSFREKPASAASDSIKRGVDASAHGVDGQIVMARAIERLALAIEKSGIAGREDEILATYEHFASGVESPSKSSERSGLRMLPSGGFDTIPVLKEYREGNSEEDDEASAPARPLSTPVLVRREAAAVAEHFRRDNKGADGGEVKPPSRIAEWVESHPLFMMLSGLALLVVLVAMTTLFMQGWLTPAASGDQDLRGGLSQKNVKATPDFATARKVALAFFRAESLAEAKPHIFQAEAQQRVLQSYYEPILLPSQYDLVFKGRDKIGSRFAYYFQVNGENLAVPLVVLQLGQEFGVFWQFTAAVGDLSWPDFLDNEPIRPALMRAFLTPDQSYDADHPPAEWSSWLAEDWSGENQARVFVRRGSPEERRLLSAFKEFGIVRDQSRWVMAQVRLRHTGSVSGVGTGVYETAEVLEVPLGSWLPAEFVGGDGFYAERDRKD